MKKIDLNTFVHSFKDELDSFEHYQTTFSSVEKKTMPEWVDSFISFAGFSEDEVSDSMEEEYDDELYYGQDYQYEELVNRRKYRSFRDDDSY